MRLFAVLALCSVVACAGLSAPESETDQPFTGTIWMLKHIGTTDIPNSKTQPFIQFDSGVFQGFGGCNRFSGTYEQKENLIRVKRITTTKMACQNIQTEQDFLNHLQRGTSYRLVNNQLVLFEGKRPLLLFKARPR